MSSEQSAHAMREEWDKLQSQLWSAWGEINRKASESLGAEVAPWHEGLEIWERIMRSGASGSTSSAPSNLVMDKLIEQGKAYLGMAQSLMHTAGSEQAGVNPSELARQWADKLRELLGQSSGGPGDWFGKMLGGAGPDQVWLKLQRMFGQFNPLSDMGMGKMPDFSMAPSGELRDMLATPAFGFSREKQEAQQALMRQLLDYQAANKRYNELMMRCIQQGLERFEDKLVERSEPGRRIETMRGIYDLWIDALEEAYAEIALSAEFRATYGELVNAQMQVRNSIQKQVEEASGQLGMPTRSEIDSVHKRVHELRRASWQSNDASAEIDALKAELAELRASVAELKRGVAPVQAEKAAGSTVAESKDVKKPAAARKPAATRKAAASAASDKATTSKAPAKRTARTRKTGES